MQEQMQERLKQLKAEYESGQKVLQELEAKRDNVMQTMLRISGAIQVLEEMLQKETAQVPAENANGTEPSQ